VSIKVIDGKEYHIEDLDPYGNPYENMLPTEESTAESMSYMISDNIVTNFYTGEKWFLTKKDDVYSYISEKNLV